MAPPEYGTKDYNEYLVRQKERRQKQRAKAGLEKRRKAAQPFVSAAVRAASHVLQQQHQVEVQKKNRMLRENNKLKHGNEQLLQANVTLERKLNKSLEEVRELRTALSEATDTVRSLEQDCALAKKYLTKWELWWSRIKERATEAFLRKIRWLSRPPPPSPEWSWWSQ